MRAEVENNVILGIASALARDPPGTKDPPYLATVEMNSNVVTCALRAPPNKLALTCSDQPGAMRVLAADALSVYPNLATVVGPEPDVEDFGTAWADLAGAGVRRGVRQRIYEVRQVQRLLHPPPGTLRPANPSDLSLVIPWIAAFFDEIPGVVKSDPAELARERLNSASLFLWDDAGPVSMAASSGKTPNGVRVNLVYTPRELRSRGYATACVWALTELLLARGNKYCCLYTNLANPTSNRMYQRIGYRPVCDVSDFERA